MPTVRVHPHDDVTLLSKQRINNLQNHRGQFYRSLFQTRHRCINLLVCVAVTTIGILAIVLVIKSNRGRKSGDETASIQTIVTKKTTTIEKDKIITTESQSSTMITTSNTSIDECYSPKITLIPATSSFSSPLEFQRNQDISIISNIEFNCTNSLSIETKWIIYKNKIQINSTIIQTIYSELYIPSQSLSYGIYEFKLTVTMSTSLNSTSSESVFINITSSGIIVNLLPFETSMITRGNQQELKFDPGTFSVDLDGYPFDANNWKYEYYCRIYDLYTSFSIIDSSCLSNSTEIIYKSSLTIPSGSLQSNRIYQFMVRITNLSETIDYTGYVLVKVEDSPSQLIVIGCVISTICVPESEFQLINPTTQIALFSICIENCTNIESITWNVYYGEMNNLSSNLIKWIPFDQMNFYENILFFGTHTTDFTATNKLFLNNPERIYWRFEVIYTFEKENSSSSFIFRINQPPRNGSCIINPLNGTTNTLFTISCSNWFDENKIKDYFVYFFTNDPSKLTMIAFSPVSTFEILLPIGKLNLLVQIRDTLNSITNFSLRSIDVQMNFSQTYDSIIELLSSGNQNTIGQIIISLSQQFNHINNQSLNKNLREYLIKYLIKLPITTLNSIQFQSSSLAQLIQSTNELTETTLMIASNKSYQLSVVLNSMSTEISYEDAHLVVNQLIQCASNIFIGINEDLNISRTNEIINLVNKMISLLILTLNNHLNLGQNFLINQSQIFLSLEKLTIKSLLKKENIGNVKIHFPENLNLNLDQIISLGFIIKPITSFENNLNRNILKSISILIVDESGNEISIETTKDHPIEIIIPHDSNLIIPPMILQNITAINSNSHNQIFHLYYINITNIFPLATHIEIHPLDTNLSYLLIYKFNQIPQLNNSINQIDGWALFCSLNNNSLYRYFINNQETVGHHHSVIFGLRELNSIEIKDFCSNSSLKNPPITDNRFNFTSDYELRIYTSGCYYLDKNNQWQSDGLVVGPQTNLYQTQCFSTHLNQPFQLLPYRMY